MPRRDNTPPGAAFSPPRPLSQLDLHWSLGGAAKALGVSRDAFRRLLADGDLPPPDRYLGSVPLWLATTVRAWARQRLFLARGEGR